MGHLEDVVGTWTLGTPPAQPEPGHFLHNVSINLSDDGRYEITVGSGNGAQHFFGGFQVDGDRLLRQPCDRLTLDDGEFNWQEQTLIIGSGLVFRRASAC